MYRLFWMARYALILQRLTGMRLRWCWDSAEAAWETNVDFPLSPRDAVLEELSCWSE